ncbi:uncharacterized protein LOC127241324 isoform X2 [Andrographis paniculata]|nr:uncharacterized protein LOC127241324 isoform X2 [Andrographis paniculata]
MSKGDIGLLQLNPSIVEQQFSSDNMAEGEKLRRKRISRANKGMVAWNKGRKHSAETIQRIKERTRIAMQDPKIRMKMKFINLGNAQSEATKEKIGVAVRLKWEKRKQNLKNQDTCLYEWQNLIAEAARDGLCGEQEFEWDSYKTLNKQLEHEHLQSVRTRNNTTRAKGVKRAPKSTEQKRKSSEAISSKLSDPEYRGKVSSEGPKRHPARNMETSDLEKHGIQSNEAQLAKIRAQRAAVKNKKDEAISRAKLLIAKAEAAAMALEEDSGQNSRNVQATLVESRILIAKANHFLESIEDEDLIPFGNDPSLNYQESYRDHRGQNAVEANGICSQYPANIRVEGFRISEFFLKDLENGSTLHPCHGDIQKTEQAIRRSLDLYDLEDHRTSMACGFEYESKMGEGMKKQGKMIKKWIRGRLVEVTEEALDI